jgi:hypothetical protein
MQESSLHASLKAWYSKPGDMVEWRVGNYYIDLVRGQLLIEIQTGSFSALKKKLGCLLDDYPIRIVYPIPSEKWIVRVDKNSERVLSKRKSPKKGSVYNAFSELVRIAKYLSHPNFSFEVVLTREEEIRLNDGKGSWRRKGWSKTDRRLLSIVARHEFSTPMDYQSLLPIGIPELFTVNYLASGLKIPGYLAGKMVYCMRHMGLIIPDTVKRGRAYQYRLY